MSGGATCPMCGQSVPETLAGPLSPAERDALSAWWHTGSIKAAADLLSRAEQTVKNELYHARIRNNVPTTFALARMHFGQLRSMSALLASHKSRRREVA